jgi:hypothetical protein
MKSLNVFFTFQQHCGTGVYSISNRNEYQIIFLESEAQPMLEANSLTVACEPVV